MFSLYDSYTLNRSAFLVLMLVRYYIFLGDDIMSTISLSKNTLSILKVAAQINNSILFKPGQEIKTATESGVIMLHATIDETWPREFAVYELNRLLQVLNQSAMSGAQLNFEDGQEYVEIKANRSKVRYNFSDASMISYQDRAIVINPADVNLSFLISEQTLADSRKMAGVLGHTHIKFKVENNKVLMITSNPTLDGMSNEYTTEIELAEGETYPDGEFSIKLENLILLDGSYRVTIFKGLAVEFAHQAINARIFLGLERK